MAGKPSSATDKGNPTDKDTKTDHIKTRGELAWLGGDNNLHVIPSDVRPQERIRPPFPDDRVASRNSIMRLLECM